MRLPKSYRLDLVQSINKNEIPQWPACLATFWPLTVGTLHERKILLKKYQNARSFFLSHTSKLNKPMQWDVVSKSTAKIYPSNKYIYFRSVIIDQSWNTLQLKNIVLRFHPPFEPITALFTISGLWPTSTGLTHRSWLNLTLLPL